MSEPQHISNVIPAVIEMMKPSTPENPVSIEDWEKWFPEFQTRSDPQLERMKQEALRFGREAFEEVKYAKSKREKYRGGYRRLDMEEPAPPKIRFSPRWLSLLGPSGTGKTMLAKKIADKIDRFSFELWLDIAATVRAGGHDEFLAICDREFVVVDDVFSEYRTEFSDAKLCEFFTRREYKWTLVTANVSMETIAEKYDQRIASRMIRHNSVVVDVDLPDYNATSA